MVRARVLGPVLDALYPRRCVGCGGPGWPFCTTCSTGVATLSPPGCRRCGRPLEWDVDGCSDCPPGPISWARAGHLYRGPVRRGLIRLKFAGLRSLAGAFGPAMADALTTAPPWALPDPRPPGSAPVTLTWVPLGRRRRRERGFDQAELLADVVAERLDTRPIRLLERARETPPQAQRSGPDRRRALSGAFRAVARPPPRVVLVDDVLTSGATAAACAAELLRAGAVEVGLLTAARSLGQGVPARCYTSAGLPPGSVVARERFSR